MKKQNDRGEVSSSEEFENLCRISQRYVWFGLMLFQQH